MTYTPDQILPYIRKGNDSPDYMMKVYLKESQEITRVLNIIESTDELMSINDLSGKFNGVKESQYFTSSLFMQIAAHRFSDWPENAGWTTKDRWKVNPVSQWIDYATVCNNFVLKLSNSATKTRSQ